MRPLPGDDAHARPRASDDDGLSTFRLPSAPQMTYSLGDESTISSSSSPHHPGPSAPPHRRVKDHHKPVTPAAVPPPPPLRAEHPGRQQRLPSHHDFERNRDREAATASARPSSSSSSSKAPVVDHPHRLAHRHGHDGHDDFDVSSPFPRPADTPSLSQPLTPVLFPSSTGPASALSSVSSRRNSLCLSDDLASCPPSTNDGNGGDNRSEMNDNDVAVEDEDAESMHAYVGEHGGGREGHALGGVNVSGETSTQSSMMDSGSAPQLVMPSIKMPSRRPFTDDGKRMGRLKLLIAGDSGVGKTSLIKAVVQSCEHIVHVDPITPFGLLGAGSAVSAVHRNRQRAGSGNGSSRRQQQQQQQQRGSSIRPGQITEIYASTKPYPEWWSEVDDLSVLGRKKSMGDAVLDRNICFVDTPGYGSGSSSLDTITPVTQYIEAHWQRINANLLSDGDLLNLIGGEGGVQVDAVLYLVSNRLRPVDIEYLRQVAPLTNIIILLAQSDLMSAEQVAASKAQIQSQLKEVGIRLFNFSDDQGIYAISSATGSDHDTMDASLLMSSDYVQPLIPTELSTLVSQVFSPTGITHLRHSVARKYLHWRNPDSTNLPSLFSSRPPSLLSRTQTAPLIPNQQLSSFSSPAPSPSPLSPSLNPAPASVGTSYALARLADHTHREERLAQVRLANWAADLQKSIAREREQYAALARGERAVWLAERMGECVRDGGLEGLPPSGQVVVAERGLQRQNHQQQAGHKRGHRSSSGSNELAIPSGRRRSRRQDLGYGNDTNGSEKYIGTMTMTGTSQSQNQTQLHAASHPRQRNRQDPLGLLEVADELRHKGLIALEVLGSLSVLGGLALWVTKHYLYVQSPPGYGGYAGGAGGGGGGVGSGLGWLVGEWDRFWNGVR
ncbi:uncharacterized protein C8A04DRAFT_28637 [Dichotomopilus funicola]|uniref:Septin-type G domain-containing protein n=1 Tax=Dichotomopilus funicola TaxID=1934379 RepID=A0AAN6ZLG6_9PEZI|nr:hypothetical protein C8A04DRAFT_28637 [Dichotomopilus funicola]